MALKPTDYEISNEAKWHAAKASAVRVVKAPGPKFCVETAYQADGSRVVRTKRHGDGYVTVVTYIAAQTV